MTANEMKKLEIEVLIARVRAGMLEQELRIAQKLEEVDKMKTSVLISRNEIEKKEKELLTME